MKTLHWRVRSDGRCTRNRYGGSLGALVFWIGGIAIFFLPFLEERDGEKEIGTDFSRAEIDIPFDEDVAAFEEDYELELAGLIADASEKYFGADSEILRSKGILDMGRLSAGRESFLTHCSGCHGVTGDGGGPAARYLSPRPRNFRKGTFKFTSTQSGEKPLRQDLFDTITRGLSGSSMPDFRLFPSEFRHDLVEYVCYLAMRGEFEQSMLDDAYDQEELPDPEEWADIIYERWDPNHLRGVYPDTAEPDRDQASIERGRALFFDQARTSCTSCHGDSGKGDGVNADSYEDLWGYKIRPRDFTRGVFRAGPHPESLWRSIATGINGTPMGSFNGNLDGGEIWDLVHFVQSLADAGGAK